MTNNLEYFIVKKYGKKRKRHFAKLLWPDARNETESDRVMLSKKIGDLVKGNPKSFIYELLERIVELLDINEMNELWTPIETD